MASLLPRFPQLFSSRAFSTNGVLHKMGLRPLHYHLPLFPGFQLLDVAAPLDILNIRTQYPDTSAITLTVSAATPDPVSVKPIPPPKANWRFDLPASNINTACNQQMLPQCTFADVVSALKAGKVAEDGSGEFKPIDVLIIPGGPGTRLNRIYDTNTPSNEVKVPNTQEVQDFLTAVAPFVRHSIITVCTGSHVLSQTGLLDGRQVTTNSARYDDVAKQTGDVKWQRNRRWLRDSVPKDAMSDGLSLLPGVEIWSSAGITAGIDVMLEFISEYYGGIEVGIETAKRMEYRWEREKEASYFL
jgi:transcriptional regulator GlxA family with amidase domain